VEGKTGNQGCRKAVFFATKTVKSFPLSRVFPLGDKKNPKKKLGRGEKKGGVCGLGGGGETIGVESTHTKRVHPPHFGLFVLTYLEKGK